MKAVVWGCGGKGKEFLDRRVLNYKYDILCFTDSNSRLWGSYFEDRYKVIPPNDIVNFDYDIVIVCVVDHDEIINNMEKFGIDKKRIKIYKDLEKELCDAIVSKYDDNSDPEIQNVLDVYRTGELSFFGSYHPAYRNFSDVKRDADGFPYIVFEDKKMFYPKDHHFQILDGREVVADILYEQGENSPHRYIPDGYKMPPNAIILDAGVCEGNFALRYVEDASKIYLVEADERWMQALEMTFKPFREKVVFCNKFLSGRNNSKEITIDSLVNEKLDFLKMDIEGSEVYALLGGRKTLESSNTQCAICTYHRQYDEDYVSFIMKSYGYATSKSKGYVFFSYDDTIADTLDLRRGVVYASKRSV